ncbi:MAG: hypothetical protein ACYTHJ_10740 [Planctomycetota bacterium]|jgi:hypothetical protein
MQRSLLHIRRYSETYAAEIEQDMAEAGVAVRTCDDVYMALALLLANGSQVCRTSAAASDAEEFKVDIVVVCVDDFDSTQLEFFSLLRRHQPAIRIYTYGGSDASERIMRSLELGADGEYDRDLVVVDDDHDQARAVAEPAQIPKTGDAAFEPEGPPADALDPGANAAAVIADDGATIDEVEGDHAPDLDEADVRLHDDVSRPVRVPWLGRETPPARQAPGGVVTDGDAEVVERSGHNGGVPESREATDNLPNRGGISQPGEPLLSQEELRALLDLDHAPSDSEADAGAPEDFRLHEGDGD